MIRDTFDMFTNPDSERGRFGEAQTRPNKHSRVTGSSNLIDLDMIHHTDLSTSKAIFASFSHIRSAGKWLPRSQIEILETGPVERIRMSVFDQKVRVTMPEWLAIEKGLI